jgi:hypothetical protein
VLKQLEFKDGEWIDRQHGNKIQVPTAPCTTQQA